MFWSLRTLTAMQSNLTILLAKDYTMVKTLFTCGKTFITRILMRKLTIGENKVRMRDTITENLGLYVQLTNDLLKTGIVIKRL